MTLKDESWIELAHACPGSAEHSDWLCRAVYTHGLARKCMCVPTERSSFADHEVDKEGGDSGSQTAASHRREESHY